MRLALIAFTARGGVLARRIAEDLSVKGFHCTAYFLSKQPCPVGLSPVKTSLSRWTEDRFGDSDGILFVGACGIAVRAVAPHLRSKGEDPAVVVVDERGRFAVSLLSGHIGGANDLASMVAQSCNATAVITTATDVEGLFSVDQWAARNGMTVQNLKAAKSFSAALLAGEKVGFCSDFPLEGTLPEGVEADPGLPCGMAVTCRTAPGPFAETVRLLPRVLTLGIGCRKGIAAPQIEEAVAAALNRAGLDLQAVRQVCTIDLKAREQGLIAFCKSRQLAFRTYCAEELAEVPGSFTSSAFVREVTGVENVCERAAVLGSGGGPLLFPKFAYNGVTVAAAAEPCIVRF